MVLFVALALSQAAASSTAAPAERPNFSFRDFVAGEEVASDRLRSCTVSQPDVFDCVEGDVDVGGANSFLMEILFRKRLSVVSLVSDQHNWTTLRRAFIAKYGDPCRQEVVPWQNAAGATVRNINETWCFRTGELSLQQYGDRLSETSAMYIDANKAGPPPARVNF